jgi:hypothetical protein
MEQRVLITYLQEDGHGSRPIHSQFVEHYEDKALSYPDVGHWVWHFRIGSESFEDCKRSERPPDFQAYFRIEGAREASLNASVRDIAQTTGIAPSIVFYVLTQVLHLEVRIGDGPRTLSDDQKRF